MRARWLGGVLLTGSILSLLSYAPRASRAETATASAALSGVGIDGRYLFLQTTVTVAEVPVVVDVVATTRAVSLQDLKFSEGRLSGTGRLCDVRVESSSSLVKTELPPALKRLLSPVRTDATIVERDGRSIFRQGAQVVVLGAKLKGAREPLPADSDDVRVHDADGDGHPGVTVKISGLVSGNVFVVQRSVSRLEGEVSGSAIRGRVLFDHEQTILGASHPLLKNGPSSKPDLSRSQFSLEKVSEDFDCAAALKRVFQSVAR